MLPKPPTTHPASECILWQRGASEWHSIEPHRRATYQSRLEWRLGRAGCPESDDLAACRAFMALSGLAALIAGIVALCA